MVLECPACEAKFNLKRYVPDKRVRCRRCRAVVVLPAVEGQGLTTAPELDPERRARLVRALSIPRLSVMAGVSAAVLVPLCWFAFEAYGKAKQRVRRPDVTVPQGPVRLEELREMNYGLPVPLMRGRNWTYQCGSDTETHTVVTVAGGDGCTAPEFTVRIRRRSGSTTRTYRLERDGIFWVRREVDGSVQHLDPPLRLVPLPLLTDSVWSAGETRVGSEIWSLRFEAEGAETVTVPAGTFRCTRVKVSGARGNVPWEERVWYAKGVGVVKRESPDNPRCPHQVLTARSF